MYNRIQIEKNLSLFESSLNEVFSKLSLNPFNKTLNERVDVTMQIAYHVRDSLQKYNDEYIRSVIDKIDSYKSRYNQIIGKSKIVKYETALT